jgi:hypothetical protein
MFLVTAVGMGFVIVSMAEMASMCVAARYLGPLHMGRLLTETQGSYIRRTVPLGLRVRAEETPEILELSCVRFLENSHNHYC